MRSKKVPHPSPARLYCSADMRPRCSRSISVRPSPRSLRTTITSSYTSSPGWSEIVKTSRSGSMTSWKVPFQLISRRSGPPNIVARGVPPSLTSINTVETGTSASGPPNQSANRSGSVHSFHTRSRGTSKTRVMMSPVSDATSGLGRSAILALSQALLEPVDGVLEGRRAQPRGAKLRRAAPRYEPRLLEHLKVLGDGLHADRERLGELVDGGLALREPSEDLPARRIGERREGGAELVGRHSYSGNRLIKSLLEYGTRTSGEKDGKDRRNRVRLTGRGHGGPGRRGLQVQGLELRLRSRRGGQQVQARRDLPKRGAAARTGDL